MIESSFVNLYRLRDDKVKELDLIKSEIFKINRQLKINEIETNVELYDSIELLQSAYESRDHDKVKNLLHKINSIYNSDILIDLDANFESQVEKSKIYGDPLELPQRWNSVLVDRSAPCLVGAASGVGKTTFACNVIYDALIRGKTALMFTLEPSPRNIWNNLYRIHRKITNNVTYNFFQVQSWMNYPGKYKNDYTVLREWCKQYDGKLKIVEANGFNSNTILAVYDQMIDRFGGEPDWVFIDYFQIIAPDEETKRMTRREQVNFASENIRMKCKNTSPAWCVLSQINADEGYRESSKIKDDAATGILLHRDYNKETREYASIMDIIITKGRHTGVGKSTTGIDGVTGVIG